MSEPTVKDRAEAELQRREQNRLLKAEQKPLLGTGDQEMRLKKRVELEGLAERSVPERVDT